MMENSKRTSPSGFADADIVYAYSRADAIRDGVLIDVTNFAGRYMPVFKIPVAITRTVYCRYISAADPCVDDEEMDVASIVALRNLLLQAYWAMKDAPARSRQVKFDLPCLDSLVRSVIASVDPGDNAEPVLTLMTNEDL